MAPLLSPRRTDPEVSLRATVTRPDPVAPPSDQPAAPPVGWPAVAVGGGLVAAAAGWILCAGIAVVGWLAAETGTLPDALRVGTRFWLLSNGVGIQLGAIELSLVPWGSTAVLAFLVSQVAAAAGRQVKADAPTGPGIVAVAVTASYLVPVVVLAVLFGEPWRDPGRWAVAIALLAAAAAYGAARSLGLGFTDRWPGWLRPLPRAVLGAQLVLLAGGAAVLVTGLTVHLGRVRDLQGALDPGILGGIALLVVQLAFLPNAIVFAGSYALGSGFSLGNGSLVAPASTQLGILPGVPLLGALPANGPGTVAELWWLGTGVLAGTVAAWLAVRGQSRARFDLVSLIGGLAGVLGGAVFTGLAWAAGGDLGTLRLAGLGPRLGPLLVMAGTTMGLAGLITGLLVGLVRRRPAAAAAGAPTPEPVEAAEAVDADEPTAVIGESTTEEHQ